MTFTPFIYYIVIFSVCELCFDNHHNHNNIVDDGKKWMVFFVVLNLDDDDDHHDVDDNDDDNNLSIACNPFNHRYNLNMRGQDLHFVVFFFTFPMMIRFECFFFFKCFYIYVWVIGISVRERKVQ